MQTLVKIFLVLLYLLLAVIVLSVAVEFYREGNVTAIFGAAIFALPLALLAWYLRRLLKRGRFARSKTVSGRSGGSVWSAWDWRDWGWFLDWNLPYFIGAAVLALMAFAGVQDGTPAYAVTPGVLAAGLAIKGILKFFD